MTLMALERVGIHGEVNVEWVLAFDQVENWPPFFLRVCCDDPAP